MKATDGKLVPVKVVIVAVEMPIEVRPSRFVDDIWVASCPLLGLMSQGASEDAAVESIRDAITSWSRAMYDRGLSLVPGGHPIDPTGRVPSGFGVVGNVDETAPFEVRFVTEALERARCAREREEAQPLARARAVVMTDAEEAQRRSFAFGNASIDNPNVTRAMVDEAADRTPRRDQ